MQLCGSASTGLAAPAIASHTLIRHPSAFRNGAILLEHMNWNTASRIPIAANPNPFWRQERDQLFGDVTPDMIIWKEGIFGPVLRITPFDKEEEAIDLANDTPYGLTNYIQTEDK